MPPPLSDEIIERARVLHKAGLNWNQVSKRMGLSMEALRRRIDPHYAAHRLMARRRIYQSRPRQSHNGIPIGRPLGVSTGETLAGRADSVHAPADVIAERDWRLAQDMTLSQRLLGDPKPGQSALEQGVTANLSGCQGVRPGPWDPRSKLRSVQDFTE